MLVKNRSHLIRENRLLKIRKCIFLWNGLEKKECIFLWDGWSTIYDKNEIRHLMNKRIDENGKIWLLILPPSLKICHIFPFSFVLKNLSHFTFTIFSSGPHISLTHSHLHFIIKLIYKSRTHTLLTFSIHFLLYF